MNRYPLWKYVLIAIALTIGLLYTLPNFFGEVPAVQISPAKTTAKIDETLLSRVDQALSQASIKPDGMFLDPASIKVRFANTDMQLKAKDVLQGAVGENYVVALNLLSSSPRWLTRINALPMYLGLDLRGGVHFLLQVDMKGALTKAADRYAADIRITLRGKEIRYAGISREGQNVVVKFRDSETRDKAAAEIGKQNPDLLLNSSEGGAEYAITAALRPEVQKRIQEFAIQQNITTLRNRVNELGVAEPIVQQAGADRVVVQLPGVQDTAKAKDILGRTATLEVRMVDEEHSDAASLQAAIGGQLPFGDELLYDRDGAPHLLKTRRDPDRRPHIRCPTRVRQPDRRTCGPYQSRRTRRHDLPTDHARQHRQAHGDGAGGEGQGRGRHCAGDPFRDTRRPRADQRAHDYHGGTRRGVAVARRRAGGADGNRRGANGWPEPWCRQHQARLRFHADWLHLDRHFHDGLLPALRRDIGAVPGDKPACCWLRCCRCCRPR